MSRALGALTLSAALTCAHSWASAAERLQEVTVTAQHSKLAKRVSKFVEHIAAPEDENGLPRWNGPICPLVLGLNQQADDLIRERIREVAHAARAPVARESCHPNLFIVVTADPKKFLSRLSTRGRINVFGDVFNACKHTSKFDIDEFIATPRPVSIWYQTTTTDDWGRPASGGKFCSVSSEASHILRAALYDFSSVWVLADYTRLGGVSAGQLADYIAMVSLAKIKPGAHLGDSPSILHLFQGKPEAAPDAMTDWDQAFLKSLYSTERRTKLQPSQIVRAMVRDIGHR
ncbi:MAG: hypothetical protein ACREUT_19560 [Steroidobacteraceae bacterium]